MEPWDLGILVFGFWNVGAIESLNFRILDFGDFGSFGTSDLEAWILEVVACWTLPRPQPDADELGPRVGGAASWG